MLQIDNPFLMAIFLIISKLFLRLGIAPKEKSALIASKVIRSKDIMQEEGVQPGLFTVDIPISTLY